MLNVLRRLNFLGCSGDSHSVSSVISLTCRGLIEFQRLFGPLHSLIDSFHAKLNKSNQPGKHIRGGLNRLHPHCPGTNQCERVYSKVMQMLKELTARSLVSQASFDYHKKNLQIRFISRSRLSRPHSLQTAPQLPPRKVFSCVFLMLSPELKWPFFSLPSHEGNKTGLNELKCQQLNQRLQICSLRTCP